MRRLLSIALLLAACAEKLHDASPGEHQIAVGVPSEWTLLDQGRQTLIREGERQIVLIDLGPATPEGYRDEAIRIRDLWLGGRDREARSRMEDVGLSEGYFASRDAYDKFLAAWHAVLYSSLDVPRAELSAHFAALLKVLAETEPAALESIADAAMEDLGFDDRRHEIRSRERFRLDDRDAIKVDTWMTLTHQDPRRYAFVLNEGRLLAMHHNRTDPDSVNAFDAVAGSVQFRDDGPR